MICNKCGKECEDNSAFCTECGNKLGETAESLNQSLSEKKENIGEVRRPAFFDDSPTVVLNENDIEDAAAENDKKSDEKPAKKADITPIQEKNPAEAPIPAAFNDNSAKESVPEKKESPVPTVKQNNSKRDASRFDDNSDTMTIEIPQIPASDNSQPAENPVRDHINNDYKNKQNNTVQPVNNRQPPVNDIPEQIPPPPIDPVINSKQDKHDDHKNIGGGRIFIASILAFFAMIFLFALNTVVSVKFGFTGKLVRERIENININTALSSEFNNAELSEDIYNTLGFGDLTDGKADKNSFKDYLSDTNVLEYVGENVENYLYYIRTNKGDDPTISAEDIAKDFFKANNDVCKEHFGCKLGKDDIKLIEERLDENNVSKNLVIEDWEIEGVYYALSYISIGILAAFVLLLFICIVIIVDKRGRHVLSFLGNILLFPGLLTFIIGVASTVGIMVAYTVTGNAVFYIISMLALPLGIMFLITGFAEIIFAAIFKAIGKSLKRKHKTVQKLKKEELQPIYS